MFFFIFCLFLLSYQNGPDTYLLQLRDVDFPVRLREYMKVAANRGPGSGYIMSDENGYDWGVSMKIIKYFLQYIVMSIKLFQCL